MGTLSVNDLAQRISKAMDDEWLAVKGEPLSDQGKQDRDILFTAIARGVLRYLEDVDAEIATTDTTVGSETHHHQLQISVTES